MASFVQISVVFLLAGFVVSCTGQKKTDLPGDSIRQPEIDSPDFDPYFIETNAVATSYGPGSITRNIIEDRNGNIWLATWEGIIRYDGSSFTNVTNKAGLRRFHTFAVLEDRKGNIWCGTIGAGVYQYDGQTFTNFTTKEGLANDRVGYIYEDKAGNIWFGTESGASRYDGKSFRNFTTKEGLANDDVNSIIEDKTGRYWFGTRGNACYYDGKVFTRFTNQEGSPFVNVRSMIEDKEGNIWLGGNDGLWRYDGTVFTNYTTDFVGYIYEDEEGNIWTSSEDSGNSQKWALSRYDETSVYSEQATPTPILVRDGMFFGILEDGEGGIWFGTLKGVCRYNGKSFNCFNEEDAGN